MNLLNKMFFFSSGVDKHIRLPFTKRGKSYGKDWGFYNFKGIINQL